MNPDHGTTARGGLATDTAEAALDLVESALRASLDPIAAWRGVVSETACLLGHLWHYPRGMGRAHVRAQGFYAAHRTDVLPPLERGLLVTDLDEAATPILLVHGIADNRSVFSRVEPALRRRGYGVVHAVNLARDLAVRGDVRGAARDLDRHVERLRSRTGAETVHVIGHSLGGLVARYYVQILGGDRSVGACVTLGTAHGGSLVATLLPRTPLLRQFRPDSDLVAELAGPAPTCRTRFLSVWSHADPMMVPRRTARLQHPHLTGEDVELDHVGHLSMVDDPEVLHRVLAWLARVDATTDATTNATTDAAVTPDATDAGLG